MIVTTRLNLLTFSAQAYQAVYNNDLNTLATLLNIEKPDQWLSDNEIIAALKEAYDAFIDGGGSSLWGMFLYITNSGKKLAGIGGFKSGLDDAGLVEIVYEIFPSFKNMGLATEAASALIDYAFEHDAKGIKAHTTPNEDASIYVLRKLGMTYIRNIPVRRGAERWRWELLKSY
jgi:RimJ/RimL family protein N-acetyltransferase